MVNFQSNAMSMVHCSTAMRYQLFLEKLNIAIVAIIFLDHRERLFWDYFAHFRTDYFGIIHDLPPPFPPKSAPYVIIYSDKSTDWFCKMYFYTLPRAQAHANRNLRICAYPHKPHMSICGLCAYWKYMRIWGNPQPHMRLSAWNLIIRNRMPTFSPDHLVAPMQLICWSQDYFCSLPLGDTFEHLTGEGSLKILCSSHLDE